MWRMGELENWRIGDLETSRIEDWSLHCPIRWNHSMESFNEITQWNRSIESLEWIQWSIELNAIQWWNSLSKWRSIISENAMTKEFSSDGIKIMKLTRCSFRWRDWQKPKIQIRNSKSYIQIIDWWWKIISSSFI
jgi:hypothetical protein